ncbi:TonB-dependent receptor plug domain-containing protein, partial [Polymorphobacter multimanifer]|uniref:TonB-dependent receptor plug domain-containing protein n=1 Tax=Polymorphobacter multimanifer TaxID=1070431 RepID=UPI001668318D
GVADVGSRRGFDNIVIRGFDANASIYLDGLRVERGSAFVQQEPLGLERIEVLKGPGTVLFGQGSLVGIINQISKRPTDTPLFSTEIMGGSFGTYQGLIDIGGPVTNDGALSGRINAIYRNLEDSIDFIERRRLYVAPSLRWKSGGTTLTVLGA